MKRTAAELLKAFHDLIDKDMHHMADQHGRIEFYEKAHALRDEARAALEREQQGEPVELAAREEELHIAVCQAVSILNNAGDPQEACTILRTALAAWSDAYAREFIHPSPPPREPSGREAALQAKIDALMMEYCPDEMTEEQTAEWVRRQVPVSEPSGSRKWPTSEAGDWISDVVLDICELPDRTSPDDQPEMMLVTAEELRRIINNNAPDLSSEPSGAQEAVDAERFRWLAEGEHFIAVSPELTTAVTWLDGEQLTEAIDAAMEAQRGRE